MGRDMNSARLSLGHWGDSEAAVTTSVIHSNIIGDLKHNHQQ